MKTAANQDAYARFDILNLLASYDGPWNLKMQNYSKLNPPMQYARVQAEGVFNSAAGVVWVKDWITGLMVPALKSKLIAETATFKPEEVFFYGSIAMYDMLSPDPLNPSFAYCKCWVDNGVGSRSPVVSFTNDGNTPIAQMYGTGANHDILLNQFDFSPSSATPPAQGTLHIDGIIVSIPIYT